MKKQFYFRPTHEGQKTPRFFSSRIPIWGWALLGVTAGGLALGTGCSRDKKSLDEQTEFPHAEGLSSVRIKQREASSDINAFCEELEGENKMPLRSVREYAALRDYLLSQAKDGIITPEKLRRAHRNTLRKLNIGIQRLLLENKKSGELKNFRVNLEKVFRGYQEMSYDEKDLTQMIDRVMGVWSDSSCSKIYLDYFFTLFLLELDPFSKVAFGSYNHRSDANTLYVQYQDHQFLDHSAARIPLDEALIREVDLIESIQGGFAKSNTDSEQEKPLAQSNWIANWFHWERWELDPQFNRTLQELEKLPAVFKKEWKDGRKRGIILDLRFAHGAGEHVVEAVKKSAQSGWGQLPMVLFVNQATQGAAAAWAYEMARSENVLVLGTSESTYGYGRILKQESLRLDEGKSEANITFGVEYIKTPLCGGHGCVLEVDKENIIRSQPYAYLVYVVMQKLDSFLSRAKFAHLGQEAETTPSPPEAWTGASSTPDSGSSLEQRVPSSFEEASPEPTLPPAAEGADSGVSAEDGNHPPELTPQQREEIEQDPRFRVVGFPPQAANP